MRRAYIHRTVEAHIYLYREREQSTEFGQRAKPKGRPTLHAVFMMS